MHNVVSYHFYAWNVPRTNITLYEGFFSQADVFFEEVDQMEAARMAMNPNVKTTIDESTLHFAVCIHYCVHNICSWMRFE